MYTLKPYYRFEASIQHPECMHKMKNIIQMEQEDKDAVDSSFTRQVAALEQRQESILKRLQALSEEVAKMSKSRKPAVMPVDITSPQGQTTNLGDVIQDLVISSSPDRVPLSVLVLKELLSRHYSVMTSCHVHSSASTVSPKQRQMLGSKMDVYNRNSYQLAITLVWKQVTCGPTLMASPNLQTAIHGEGNVARYLARLLMPPYDEGDAVAATMIDEWTDKSQFLSDNKDTAEILKTLDITLAKNDWLVGGQLSLADIMVWSSLRQTSSSFNLPSNVKKWLARCNNTAVFQTAVNFLDA